MALRVLLADESPSIKKVFQLSLQDFAVELKTVNVGVDAKEVAITFKPDIVFADVLLPKRSGYDVCADLRSDPSTQNLPLVLMWSGFMELDRERFRTCGASADLEKPFDVETLRELVKRLVPKASSNPLQGFISMPSQVMNQVSVTNQMPETPAPTPDLSPTATHMSSPMEEIPQEAEAKGGDLIHFWNSNSAQMPDPSAPPPGKEEAMKNSGWSMDSFDEMPGSFPAGDEPVVADVTEEDEFQAVRLQDFEAQKKRQPAAPPPPAPAWNAEKDMDSFRVQIPDNFNLESFDTPFNKPMNEKTEFDAEPEDIVLGTDDVETPSAGFSPVKPRAVSNDTQFYATKTTDLPPIPPRAPTPPPAETASSSMENVVRDQLREMLPRLAREIILEIAADIVKKEMHKVMQELEAEEAP